VITGMIKANVPSRIAFAVSSQTDSRVILDQNGAESLLGQGDMLFKPLGTSRLQRVQGAFVTEEEIALIVEQTRTQREQQVDESFLELPQVFADESDGEDGEFDPDEDPLLDKAIEIVVTAQTASVSLLQRRLRVGEDGHFLEQREIVRARLDSQRTLPDCGQHSVDIQVFGDALGESQAVQPCRRDADGVVEPRGADLPPEDGDMLRRKVHADVLRAGAGEVQRVVPRRAADLQHAAVCPDMLRQQLLRVVELQPGGPGKGIS
jgi:hypothetical protein